LNMPVVVGGQRQVMELTRGHDGTYSIDGLF
jgi:hypothetical protein